MRLVGVAGDRGHLGQRLATPRQARAPAASGGPGPASSARTRRRCGIVVAAGAGSARTRRRSRPPADRPGPARPPRPSPGPGPASGAGPRPAAPPPGRRPRRSGAPRRPATGRPAAPADRSARRRAGRPRPPRCRPRTAARSDRRPGADSLTSATVSGPATKTSPSLQIRSRQPSGRMRCGRPDDTLRQATTCGSADACSEYIQCSLARRVRQLQSYIGVFPARGGQTMKT